MFFTNRFNDYTNQINVLETEITSLTSVLEGLRKQKSDLENYLQSMAATDSATESAVQQLQTAIAMVRDVMPECLDELKDRVLGLFEPKEMALLASGQDDQENAPESQITPPGGDFSEGVPVVDVQIVEPAKIELTVTKETISYPYEIEAGQIYTSRELAKRLKVTVQQIRRWRKEDVLGTESKKYDQQGWMWKQITKDGFTNHSFEIAYALDRAEEHSRLHKQGSSCFTPEQLATRLGIEVAELGTLTTEQITELDHHKLTWVLLTPENSINYHGQYRLWGLD